MKKTILFAFSILTLIACKEKTKEVTEVVETEVEIIKEEVKSDDWITLFDGSNFDHWRGYNTDKMHPEWTIEDGAMAFTPGEVGGKNIITKDTYTNFILSLEWKISEAGNSGIFWGVHEDPKYNEAYRTGPEIQVLDNEKHPDAKAGTTHRAGSLYDMIAPKEDYTKPVGEWNLCVLEINHETNLGKVSLNGNHLFDFPVQGKKWDAMVANSKFKDWEGFGAYPTGHIGLQDHSDKVWYRNIKIKKLD